MVHEYSLSFLRQIPSGSKRALTPLLPARISRPLPLFRIISFESTIMGRRRHAEHVFAKVCAPNTKGHVANRINTVVAGRSWRNDILAVSFLWLVVRSFPRLSFLPSFVFAKDTCRGSWQHPSRKRTRKGMVSCGGVGFLGDVEKERLPFFFPPLFFFFRAGPYDDAWPLYRIL